MKHLSVSVLLLVVFVFFMSCNKSEKLGLEGTWQMISGVYTDLNTNERIVVDDSTRFSMKILCREHFAVVEMHKENPDSLFFAAVGMYKLTPHKYVERYQASNVGYQINTSRESNSALEEDRWTTQSSDEYMELKETWIKISRP